jgi:hypothetical protein
MAFAHPAVLMPPLLGLRDVPRLLLLLLLLLLLRDDSARLGPAYGLSNVHEGIRKLLMIRLPLDHATLLRHCSDCGAYQSSPLHLAFARDRTPHAGAAKSSRTRSRRN